MSDLYTCAHCKRTENHAGSARETDDGAFHVLRESMKVGKWLDVVAKGDGIYLHAQFCSEACALVWVKAFQLAKPPAHPLSLRSCS